MYDAGQRLNERGLLVTHPLGQMVAGARRRRHILGEAAAARNANSLPIAAVVGLLIAAEVAFPAVEVGVHCNAIAQFDAAHGAANFHHRACELVAGNKRKVGHVFVVVDMYVRTADAARRHLHNHLVRRADGVIHALNAYRFGLGKDDCLHASLPSVGWAMCKHKLMTDN